MLVHYPEPPAWTTVVPVNQVRRIPANVCRGKRPSDIDASRGKYRLSNAVWQDMENEDIPGLFHNRSRRAVRISVWCDS